MSRRRTRATEAGSISVEFACILNAAGLAVPMSIRGDTVLRGFDEDIRSALSNEMRKKGIDIRSETVIEDIEKRGDALSVMTRAGEMMDVDVVLAATGRVPNTRGLGLEAVGVAIDKDYAVAVDEMSQTAVPSIFAVGDCTNRLNLTPVAITEGRAVAETLFNDRPTAMQHTGVPSAVFSQPPAASVGLSEIEARIKYKEIDVYVANFRPMKHTLSGRDERVMMKLVVDQASERVIGCHIVGADAAEIIQGVAIAMKCGATKTQFDTTVGLHPTLAEELVTMRDKRP